MCATETGLHGSSGTQTRTCKIVHATTQSQTSALVISRSWVCSKAPCSWESVGISDGGPRPFWLFARIPAAVGTDLDALMLGDHADRMLTDINNAIAVISRVAQLLVLGGLCLCRFCAGVPLGCSLGVWVLGSTCSNTRSVRMWRLTAKLDMYYNPHDPEHEFNNGLPKTFFKACGIRRVFPDCCPRFLQAVGFADRWNGCRHGGRAAEVLKPGDA